MKTISLTIFLSILCVSANPAEENWEIDANQIYSNSSSYQFYASFVVIRGLLEKEWDEKMFDKISTYLGMDILGMEAFLEKYKEDKVWGPWFQKKTEFQKSVLDQLKPMIVKKQSGKPLTKEELALLSTLDEQITKTLLK